MAGIEIKNFDRPDETRPFEGKGRIEFVTLGGREIGRGVFEPGWRWSENVKPTMQTHLCEFNHLGYVLSGRMRIRMDDGSAATRDDRRLQGLPRRPSRGKRRVYGDRLLSTAPSTFHDAALARAAPDARLVATMPRRVRV